MTDSNPPHASGDELATHYLRNRDTPCPKCFYNRRDATSATCPECGELLRLVATKSDGYTRYQSLLISIMRVLLAVAILELVAGLFGLGLQLLFVTKYALGFSPTNWVEPITRLAVWIIMLIFIVRRLRTVKANEPMSPLRFIMPIGILFALFYLAKIGALALRMIFL